MSWLDVGLTEGWTLDGPGAAAVPAQVPGTVAGALRDAGLAVPDDLDEHPWTFRCRFATPPGERVLLRLDGLATLAEVVLGGTVVLRSRSMWEAHVVDVSAAVRPPGEQNQLELRFAPLGPEIRAARRPRARWRTRLVANGLRWHRTMLLGRAPGIAPGPAAVGPWRSVGLEVRDGPGVAGLAVRARAVDGGGVLAVRAEVEQADGVEVVLGGHRARLDAAGTATLRIPGAARWWPHTHGEPVLHEVRLLHEGAELARRRVGFRSLEPGTLDVERDGLDLHLNGVRVWARGAVWTPCDLVGLAPPESELRATLEAARDAGMNLLRVVGTAHYESAAFHDLCDELGIMVWQDAMFANLDYPLADPGFSATVEAELAALVARLAERPSTVVLCGGSEVAQQAAMLGRDAGREGVGHTLLPVAVAAGGCDAVVVPDAPTGGTRPFRSDVGVANWFGVGGYRRGLAETRRAEVRFASECLAFANVPDVAVAGSPEGVPRDAGADWDFADVRDHYLRTELGCDPSALRARDPERYLELSRSITGELMAAVLGEWRRAGSPCGGALVLALRDLVPGAGWGVLDSTGAPKVAWHHLRRACAPLAIWTTDEGLNGVAVHVANDRPEPFDGAVRVALHQGARLVEEGRTPLALPAHGAATLDAEEVLGRWADVSYAYRFGPPAHDVVVVSLEVAGVPVVQSLRFPLGRPLGRRRAEELGLVAALERGPDGHWAVRLSSHEVLYGARLRLAGWRAADDAFDVAPGGERLLALRSLDATSPPSGALTAQNLVGELQLLPPAAGSGRPRRPSGASERSAHG